MDTSVGFYTSSLLFQWESRCRYFCQCLVVVVGVSLSLAASVCCRCWILVVVVGVSLSLLASCCCRCSVVVAGSVPSCDCFRRLLSDSAPRCCCCSRNLVVVVGVSLSSSAAASRRSLKISVYIRLTMHATTMEPQHQEHNVPAVLSGVWRFDLVWPSPQ